MFGDRATRVLGVLGLAAVCVGPLIGCAGSTQAGAGDDPVQEAPAVARPNMGGRLVYGLESDPNGLDPTRNAWDNAGIQLANALYDPLVTVDANGQVQPYLVESFTANADFTTWDFKMRSGVLFSDGERADATALAAYVEALRASAITGPPAKQLTDVKVLDPLTVRVASARPWATLPMLLTGQGGYLVSPKQLADPEGHSRPIGTGPFTLRSWKQNTRFELVKNRRYWRTGLPYLDAVDFVIVPNGVERINMLGRGEMDATNLSEPWVLKHLDEVTADPAGSLRLSVEKDTGDAEKTSILFNTTRKPLDDVRVRRAIAYATDIPAIAKSSGWPLDRLAQGPFDPTSPYFSPAAYPSYDVQKAKQLVREYLSDPRVRNRPPDVTFTLLAPNIGAEYVKPMVEQWAQAGIKANVSYVDLKQMVRLAVFGEFDAINFRYFASPDPDALWHFFVNDTITAPPSISLNFTRLRSDEITSGMNEGRATIDPVVRKRGYARMQGALADQMPYLWLQRWEWRVATTTPVHDAHNVTLPDGRPALPLQAGTHRLTETWLDR
jgi:peptide/nickel transport system substrate-binding protein